MLSGQQCDEYPFYATLEGGPEAFGLYQLLLESRDASILKPIDGADNEVEGRVYGAMTRRAECGFGPAGADRSFLVIPLPHVEVPTFYVCPREAP